MKHDRFYIDGQWVEPAGKATFELVNPATEQAFATVRLGNAEDVDRAVRSARAAFETFQHTGKAERVAMLGRVADAFEARESDLMRTLGQEMGAPIGMKAHTQSALSALRQSALTLAAYEFETRIGRDIVRREPIGVCGLITAWNWPLQLLCIKLGSALAAGCTVVVKPSEYTPLSTLMVAEVMEAAGVPAGVFNVVVGDGPTVGEAITGHAGIDMVSFTGSTRAGIQVARSAAGTVKRVCQELGGKSANIILPDADLGAAARWNVARGFANSGQSCHSPSRILVQEEQMAPLVEHLAQNVRNIRVGPPEDAATTIGPVVNQSQFERIQGYIRSGIDEGARLVCGGPGRPAGVDRGYFVQPTIFADVRADMTIAREEIFGPVLSVMPYRTVDEAVAIANATPYGLGGYVFSGDVRRGYEVGRRIRAGRIFLNGAPSNNSAPMGGYKQSGNGREMGVFGLEEYLEVQAMLGFDELTPA